MGYINYVKNKNIKTKMQIFLSCISFLILFIVCSVFVIGIYSKYTYKYYPVSGLSMFPTINSSSEYLENGTGCDCVLVDQSKFALQRFDIVIVDPDISSVNVIKRIIAFGGESVMVKKSLKHKNSSGEFYYAYFIKSQNGEFVELEENYIKNKNTNADLYKDFYTENANKTFLTDDSGNKYIQLANDEIFYAGDNRGNTYDCNDYGAEKTKNIIGKVVAIITANQNELWQIYFQFLGFKKWK